MTDGSGILDAVLRTASPGSSPSSWNRETERRRLHEAIWKQSCSRTHSLWCDCGNWTSHIKLCDTGAGRGVGDGGSGAGSPGGITEDVGIEFEDVGEEIR
ncbi:hypothetical protein [Paguma larvata torque teno virus]|nr:hypothetical protein [Paguma larvata torque teno virus]